MSNVSKSPRTCGTPWSTCSGTSATVWTRPKRFGRRSRSGSAKRSHLPSRETAPEQIAQEPSVVVRGTSRRPEQQRLHLLRGLALLLRQRMAVAGDGEARVLVAVEVSDHV